MAITPTDYAPPGWQIFGEPRAGRACGKCSFCCVVVPVELPLNKPGGVKCQFLAHKGCAIYARRPAPCWAWSCVWLHQPEAAMLIRPDISGYAVDPMPQEVLYDHKPRFTIQVWVDPARRDAHRAPELRAYLALMAEKHRMPAIVRWPDGKDQTGQDAMILFAPCLNTDNEWAERTNAMLDTDKFNALRKAAS